VATVGKHTSFLFFPFEFSTRDAADVEKGVVQPLLRRKLHEVAASLGLPDTLLEGRKIGSTADLSVWEEARPGTRDLHPQVRAILGVAEDGFVLPPHLHREDVKRFVSHPPLTLTPEARNLLSGGSGKAGRGLEIKIRPAAMTRLGLDEPQPDGVSSNKKNRTKTAVWLPVILEDATVWLFGTGVGVVEVELHFPTVEGEGRLGTQGILEGNYACYRTGSQAQPLRWREVPARNGKEDVSVTGGVAAETSVAPSSVQGDEPEGLWACVTRDAAGAKPRPTVTLEKIVTAVAPVVEKGKATTGGTLHVRPVHWERIFTYTAVQLTESLTSERERIELAYRLSRKNTSAYLPSEERLREGLLPAYDNVLHAVAMEGGAVVVEEKDANGTEIPFLKQFIANSVRSIYRLFAILAIQEYCKVLGMVESINLPVSLDRATVDDVEYLDSVRRNLLDFQLNYRFSHASLLTVHNLVYQAWRRALDLDAMLTELRDDVSHVENYLTYHLQQRDVEAEAQRERERTKLNRVQTVIGIVVGALIALTGVFGMNITGFQDVAWNSRFVLTWVGGVFTGAAILAVGYAYWSSRIDRRRCRREQSSRPPVTSD